jgi:hypothetical protein
MVNRGYAEGEPLLEFDAWMAADEAAGVVREEMRACGEEEITEKWKRRYEEQLAENIRRIRAGEGVEASNIDLNKVNP